MSAVHQPPPPTAPVINHASVAPPGYERYPITMTHPHFRPATTNIVMDGNRVHSANGTPVMFPPVTALNEDDEERLRAEGYEVGGKVDPSAWVRAHSDAPPDTYVPQKYPMWRDGVLYMTAQEDPGADAADLVVSAVHEPVAITSPAPAKPMEDNLRAQMDAMQDTMRQMSDAMKALAAENAELKAAPPVRPKGRPRKATPEA